jgi:hypothetical protein
MTGSNSPALAAIDRRAILMCLGQELFDRRFERGWTRGHVVTLLRDTPGAPVTTRALGSYENAQRVIPLLRLFDLCALYEVPVPVLVSAAIRRVGMDDCCPTCRRPS